MGMKEERWDDAMGWEGSGKWIDLVIGYFDGNEWTNPPNLAFPVTMEGCRTGEWSRPFLLLDNFVEGSNSK